MATFKLPQATRLGAVVLASALVCGCGYPAAQPVNQELITSLRTACSAREPQWLEANAEKIDARRVAGEMSEQEHQTFMEIVQQARHGDWAGAEQACLAFQKAQGPTPEQVEKMRAFHGE